MRAHKYLLISLICLAVLALPAQALKYRFNMLLSGCLGIGVGVEQELDPLSNLRASVMVGLDPVIPVMMEANFQMFLSEERRDRQFILVGFEHISAGGDDLDFVQFGWGLSNPWGFSEKFEAALISGYFLEKRKLGLVGINLSYQI